MFAPNEIVDHVALNSTNPDSGYGDDRDFVRVKPAGAPDSAYTSKPNIVPDQRYTAAIHFHNSGDPSTSALNARVRLEFPSTIKGSAPLQAAVAADNADPPEVWGRALATLPSPDVNVVLRFDASSAVMHADGLPGPTPLDFAALTTTGAPIGCSQPDGMLPGGCAGDVTVDFVTDHPDFTVAAWVAPAGKRNYSSEASIRPQSDVTVKVEFLNIGTLDQDDVVLAVPQLPACVSIVPGTTYLFTEDTRAWTKTDQDVGEEGIKIGNYRPGANAFLKFDVHIEDADGIRAHFDNSYPEKGTIVLLPVLQVSANTKNGSKLNADDGKDAREQLAIKVLGPSQP
ncbi:MAG TPA: hypothetical protein VL634_25530 [Mycobacterium sp.]|jgi:hypothetical protein|nr:hypothetical protein [Mycobacterium sp.]